MHTRHKVLCYLLSFFIFLTSFTFLPVHKASALSSVNRLSGQDRYETAVKISQAGWQSSDSIVLATGEDFPDALSAAPLAKQLNAPILLTEKKSLSSVLENEIKRLNTKKVFIIGGEGVISKDIQTSLTDDKYVVTRLSGNDRYETSLKVAAYMNVHLNPNSEIVVATGDNFPDALSIAPIAAGKGIPIILSPQSSLPQSVKEYITGKNITKAYVIGGTGVISDKVKNDLPNAERLAGMDRYQTNVTILNRFATELNFNEVYVSTGENFPDALAGSALAPRTFSPIMLTSKTPEKSTRDFFSSKTSSIDKVSVLGGTGVVSDASLQSIMYPENNQVNAVGTSPANAANYGIASSQGGWIYYSNHSDGQKLYKMRTDGTSNQKLVDNGYTAGVNVLGDYVYYIKINSGIYKIKTDGTGEKLILSGNSFTDFLYVTNDYIYYRDNTENGLFRMKYDGSSKVKLIYGGSGFFIKDDYIYGLQNFNLFRTKLDGTGRQEILNNVYKFNVYNDSLYYIELASWELYMSKLDGSDKKLLVNDSTDDINVSGGWVYYLNNSDRGRLYKVKIDGTGRTKMSDTPIQTYINVVDGNIFSRKAKPVGYGVYKMNPDGSGKAKISNDLTGTLKVDGDYLYYVNLSDSNKIYKMKKDGTERTSLGTNSLSSDISIYDGFIYYNNLSDGNKLYKVKTDGTGNVKISDIPAYELAVYENYIYFCNSSDGEKLYSMKIDGTEEKKLSDNSPISIFPYDGWIYYSKQWQPRVSTGNFYKIKTDGTLEKSLKNTTVDKINVFNGELYYRELYNFGSNYLARRGLEDYRGRIVAHNIIDYTVSGEYVFVIRRDDRSSITKYSMDGEYGGNKTTFFVERPISHITSDSGEIYYQLSDSGMGLYQQKIENRIENSGNSGDPADEKPDTNTPVPDDPPPANEVRGNSTGNILNGGQYALQNGWVYYRNNKDGGALYKTKLDGTGKTKISSDRPWSINVIGDWIYYIFPNDVFSLDGSYLRSEMRICKIKIDGTQRTLLSDDDASYNFTVTGSYIYYSNMSDEGKLYRIKTDGTERTKLNDEYSAFVNVVGDWIYYRGGLYETQLYKMRTDGTDRFRLSSDHVQYINVSDGWIYFEDITNGSKIYKMKTDGTGLTKLSQENTGSINVSGDWIYYISYQEMHKLYKMKTDGTGRTKVSDDYAMNPHIIGDWIYYVFGADESTIYRIKKDGTGRQTVN